MRMLVLILVAGVGVMLGVAGCAAGPAETRETPAGAPDAGRPAALPVLRKTAPELTNTVWLNTEAPLRLAQLRGRVVLVDFWTFG